MDGGPHAAQFASILFRIKTHELLTKYPNVKVSMEWTPGHRQENGPRALHFGALASRLVHRILHTVFRASKHAHSPPKY